MAHAGELPEYVSDEEEDMPTSAVVGGGHARVGGASATFADFCLKPQITKAITAAGFEQPSKIQEEAIPEAHAGNDIIAQAKSGMGKTAVFVLVTLDRYDPSENPGHVYCVVVEPTKELVQQVVLEYKRFSPFMDGGGISVMSITGGESIKEQSDKLKTSPPAIIVATPGRLSDLVDKGAVDLSKIKFFVIDEVDKVLEKAGPFSVAFTFPADLQNPLPYPKFRFQTCVRTCSKSSSRRQRTSRRFAFLPLWHLTCSRSSRSS
jgi:ATP-dependent RNA helicase UAP56/SUB2